MPVTVVSNVKVVPGAQAKVTELLHELCLRAAQQPGFISAHIVVEAPNPRGVTSISDWSSMEAWEKWEMNPERNQIVDQINKMVRQDRSLVRKAQEDDTLLNVPSAEEVT